MSENLEMLDQLLDDFCRRAQLYGCDAVQVLLSMHDEAKEETSTKSRGRGNWYARQGLAKEFIASETARTEEYVRRTEFDEDDYE